MAGQEEGYQVVPDRVRRLADGVLDAAERLSRVRELMEATTLPADALSRLPNAAFAAGQYAHLRQVADQDLRNGDRNLTRHGHALKTTADRYEHNDDNAANNYIRLSLPVGNAFVSRDRGGLP